MQSHNQISISDKIAATANSFTENPSEEIRKQLISSINELINTDFNALVQLLYRIDVDEKKLKDLLKTKKDADAAVIIADLIISRQLQKITAKKQFRSGEETGSDDSW